MRAMILAAGLGTRLRPITYEMPKPMVPVLNRPVMEHICRLLARHGFGEVVANLHWFPELIRAHFGDGSGFGLRLSYSEEEALLGTAGGVRKAAGFLGEEFLVISGDALTDIDLAAMREVHRSHDGIATLATRRVEDTTQFGVVITGADGRVQGFQEKPPAAEALSDLANCGIYMFRSEIFDFFPPSGRTSRAAGDDAPPGFADWAMDVFPALLDADVPFYSHEVEAYWNDIGNLAELRAGNFDALTGTVAIEPGVPEVSPGVFTASELSPGEVTPPALVGARVAIGDGVRIEGPAVIGDSCRLGNGSRVSESILLAGAELGPGTAVEGEIVTRPSAPDGTES
jgi:mannose-1-phosphate guanylyltransferase/mannose-1-phosphate guanylyltransferase/phosphomannomutase